MHIRANRGAQSLLAGTSLLVLAAMTGNGPVDRVGGFSPASNFSHLFHGRGGQQSFGFHAGFFKTAFVDMIPVAGDFDGDGEDTVGLFDPRTAEFKLADHNQNGEPATVFVFGSSGSLPVAGDFDGDGVDTVGVYDPATQIFQLRQSNTPGPADVTFAYGAPGDFVFTGDFDGDGVDTIGAYRGSTQQVMLRNSLTTGPADVTFLLGPATSFPVAGDFYGLGRDSVALLDFTTHEFHFQPHPGPWPSRNVPVSMPSILGFWYPLAGHFKVDEQPPETQGYDWPTATPAQTNIDPVLLDAAFAHAATFDRMYSLLVLRGGQLVQEEYYHGAHRGLATNIKSITKSVMASLVGIAMDQGHLTSVHQTVESILPQYFNPGMDSRKFQIDLQDLMTMTAGISWNEVQFFNPMINSTDWVQYIIDQPQARNPGGTFLYNSGLVHVMSRLLTEATGQSVHDFACQNLLEPLGIHGWQWGRDVNGYDYGASELYLTPRDMARVGQLYLDDGMIDGQQVVSSAWIDYCNTILVPSNKIDNDRSYGAWWWHNDFFGHEVWYALGWGGQNIFVVRDLDLVVVFTSRWDVGQSGEYVAGLYSLLEDYILPAILP